MNVGRWLQRQRQHSVWQGLMDRQRERLEQLGVVPLPARAGSAHKAVRGGLWAVRAGRCWAQYKARTGSVTVPRAHLERLEDGAEVKLGVFLSNSKSRRGKLSADKLQALADLGLHWAI